MPALKAFLMETLYGYDIWKGFVPVETTDVAQGWNGDHPSLELLVQSPGTRVVIDVGVWKGQSTITMAQAMKRAEIDGCVLAVDTFLGSVEHWSPKRDLFRRTNGMPNIYQTFLSNVVKAGVEDYVLPVPQTSVGAASILKQLGICASVIHIDAAHEYEEVFRDATEYWKILDKGGYLIGDDYDKSWPGVIRAAGEFSARQVVPLTVSPPKWIMQKPA